MVLEESPLVIMESSENITGVALDGVIVSQELKLWGEGKKCIDLHMG